MQIHFPCVIHAVVIYLPGIHKASAAKPVHGGQGHVAGIRKVLNKPLRFSILRYQPQTVLQGILRTLNFRPFPFYVNLPAGIGVCPEYSPHHIRSLGAHQSGKGQNLASVELKAYVFKYTVLAQVPGFQHHLAGGAQGIISNCISGHIPAYHVAYQLFLGCILHVQGSDIRSVAQNTGPVRYGKYLVQTVCDIQYRNSLVLEFHNHLKQTVYLAVCQG